MNTQFKTRRVTWRRHDLPGQEECRIRARDDSWQIDGDVIVANRSTQCHLQYVVHCDKYWITQSAHVTGRIDNNPVNVTIVRDKDARWRWNGQPVDAVSGCDDVDISFTPSTNTLPIKRANLQLNESAGVRAAWLRFPDFTLLPLEQHYTRTGNAEYQYASATGAFTTVITVDDFGLVMNYGSMWSRAERCVAGCLPNALA